MCERWVGDRTKAATIWPPVPPSLAALLSRSVGLLNRRPWGPSSLLDLVLTASNCNNWLQTPNWLELPVAPGYIIVSRPPVSVSIASAPNSTRPQSRLSPDIFDRMHQLFIQVHLLFDSSAGSEVNMLHYVTVVTRNNVLCSSWEFLWKIVSWMPDCPLNSQQKNKTKHAEYPFVAITPGFTLAWSGSTCLGLIYGLAVWYLKCVQTKD